MPAIFELRHTITDAEIDGHGHANNVAYVSWMQSAAIAHSTAQGWPPERYDAERQGWVVRTHAIEYFAEAFLGQEIVVRTWIGDFRKITSLRKYRIERVGDGALLAKAETNWVFIGLDNRVPRRIPPAFAESFELVPPDREPR